MSAAACYVLRWAAIGAVLELVLGVVWNVASPAPSRIVRSAPHHSTGDRAPTSTDVYRTPAGCLVDGIAKVCLVRARGLDG